MLANTIRLFTAASRSALHINETKALLFTIHSDRPGALNSALRCFYDYNLNLTHIKSDALDSQDGYTFIADFEWPEPGALEAAVRHMKEFCSEVSVLGSTVPWFPRKWEDLDNLTQSVGQLPSTHPGFGDREYNERRAKLQQLALSVKGQEDIPLFEYSNTDVETWRTLYIALSPLFSRVACPEFTLNFKELEEKGLIRENEVPQLGYLNAYLRNKTGFQLKPIAALQSQRDFLNCLALRVFPTTVHMRHHSQPYFSMDPDVAHEALGHLPMLADPGFAEFVQGIGLASLGATAEDVQKLMNLYFYSIEHGVLLTKSGKKEVYGARLLSSVDEIYHVLSDRPELRHFNPFETCKFRYSRRGPQQVYWFSSSFSEAQALMRRFEASLSRPFRVVFDRHSGAIQLEHKAKK